MPIYKVTSKYTRKFLSVLFKRERERERERGEMMMRTRAIKLNYDE
jgi:hypothetical protein